MILFEIHDCSGEMYCHMTCPSTNISFLGYPIRLPLSLLLIPMYPIHLPILMGFTLPKLPKRPSRNSLRGQFPNHMAPHTDFLG